MEILSIVSFQVLVMLLIVVVGGLAICIATTKSIGTQAAVARCSRFLLACTVFTILLVSFVGPAGVPGMNMVPFRSIYSQWNNANTTIGFFNIFGNVVMYLPVGLFLILSSRFRWFWSLLTSLAVSVTVEVVQQFTGRSSDIDDVLLNTAGALMGIAIGVLLRKQLRLRVANSTRYSSCS